MRVVAVVVGVVALGSVLAGCGGQMPGSPQPSGGPGDSSSSGAPPTASAPKVADPLDPGKYAQNPCGLLSNAQMKSFGFTSSTTPKVTPSPAGGKECGWHDHTGSTGAGLGISWLTDNTHGLSSEYSLKSEDLQGGYFEPTTVSGYPAVFASQSDDRADGTCVLTVGVNDHLEFLVDMQNGPDRASKACSMAKSAAAAAIDTLKKGGS